MAFPADPLPLHGELRIAGVWVDISKDIRLDEQIVITGRGTANEVTSLPSAVCAFKLNNGISKVVATAGQVGVYSNRNPNSPYFGLLPQNTPFRAYVEDSSVRYEAWPNTGPGVAYIETADKAVLDLTGDLDIRIDMEMLSWTPQAADAIVLASKYLTTGDQRSWLVRLMQTGRINLAWSTDGTLAARIDVSSPEPLPLANGRQAVRVTLDVNNGAGGYTVTWYTAPTIGGSWTQFAQTVTTAGTTSVHSGSGALTVGGLSGNVTSGFTVVPDYAYGRWYGFELRNGIAGTLVADLDPTGRTPGDTTWSDGLGTPNTWTLFGDTGEVTTGNRRFVGEIAQLPVEWDTTGTDVYARVQANDITRRLTQGADALHSALYRFIGSDAAQLGELTGWWPLEDTAGSTQAAGVIGPAAALTDIQFGADPLLPSVDGVAEFTSTSSLLSGTCVLSAAASSQTFTYLYAIGTRPAGENVVFHVRGNGTMRRWEILLGNTTTRLRSYDVDGTLQVDDAFTDSLAPTANYIIMSLSIEQDGSNVDWELRAADVEVGGGFGGSLSGTYAGSVGRFTSWVTGTATNLVGLKLAQIFVGRNISDFSLYTTDFYSAALAFVGELAGERLRRIAAAEGVAMQVVGPGLDTEPMGPQRSAKVFEIFEECARVDGGRLFTPREFLGYRYRTGLSLLNLDGLSLSYSDKELSGELRPVEDDQVLRNDVTASKPTGSEGHSVRETGPKGVATVGRYQTTISYNPEHDERLAGLAQRATHIGTWDEARYPSVQVNLERINFTSSAALTAAAAALDVGDFFRLTGLPAWLPPDDVELLVQGARERLGGKTWEIVWNASPYGPYRVNDLTLSELSVYRAAASNTALAVDVTSGATSMVIVTPTGRMWRRSSGAPAGTFPLDVNLHPATLTKGGEVCTVSALANVTLAHVAVGTGAHANNASVSPSLPAGLAQGDLMLLLAANRDTAATVNTPSGWTVLSSSENVSLFARMAGASESAPTVSFTGSGAGDSCSAQIDAWRPSSPLSTTADLSGWVIAAAWQSNASAQDIATPYLGLVPDWADDALVLYLGWKADDWTSVANPGSDTGEPSTTLGDDQGITWGRTVQTARAAIAASSHVVTGGGAAISKGAVVVIHPRHQLLTVTRSVNGVVKAQTAGVMVQVNEPFHAAL